MSIAEKIKALFIKPSPRKREDSEHIRSGLLRQRQYEKGMNASQTTLRERVDKFQPELEAYDPNKSPEKLRYKTGSFLDLIERAVSLNVVYGDKSAETVNASLSALKPYNFAKAFFYSSQGRLKLNQESLEYARNMVESANTSYTKEENKLGKAIHSFLLGVCAHLPQYSGKLSQEDKEKISSFVDEVKSLRPQKPGKLETSLAIFGIAGISLFAINKFALKYTGFAISETETLTNLLGTIGFIFLLVALILFFRKARKR